jgi:threonine/homoserine/homoserine lactone efflux protein
LDLEQRAAQGLEAVGFDAVVVGQQYPHAASQSTIGVMLRDLPAFLAIAVVVVLTPGPATALVVRNSLRGGPRAAWATTAGNSTGILAWALASVLGISALVAASEAAFAALKLVGAAVLIWLGIQAWRRSRAGLPPEPHDYERGANHYREGLVTSFANPKLAVFFVALFPQFVPDGASVLAATLLMAAIVVTMDLVYFTLLAVLVSRTRHAFVERGWASRMERVAGTVLIALGVRLALSDR